MLCPIGHHDDQISGISLDGMLSPVQRATLEHGGVWVTTGVSHTSDDAIARCTELSPARSGCRISGVDRVIGGTRRLSRFAPQLELPSRRCSTHDHSRLVAHGVTSRRGYRWCMASMVRLVQKGCPGDGQPKSAS